MHITQGVPPLISDKSTAGSTDSAPRPLPPQAFANAREALAFAPWLQAVPPATLDTLAEQAVMHRVPAGSILFEHAETPSFAQFLLTGCVDLVAANRESTFLVEAVQPIDLLLPAAVLNRQPYLARAQVRIDSLLILIHADAFRSAVTSDHAFCLAVLACQAAQFRRQMKLAHSLRIRSAEERVACYLLQILDGAQPNTPPRLPLEKRHIAWQLGMTRETLSRTLASLARHGVRIAGDAIMITDPGVFRSHWHLDPLTDAPEPIMPLALGLR
jgi:CRP/FNR family transcriptional activator FtrB